MAKLLRRVQLKRSTYDVFTVPENPASTRRWVMLGSVPIWATILYQRQHWLLANLILSPFPGRFRWKWAPLREDAMVDDAEIARFLPPSAMLVSPTSDSEGMMELLHKGADLATEAGHPL